MNKYKLKNIQLLVMLSISIVTLVIIFSSIDSYQNQFGDLETDRIQEVVEKYAVQCYATEGAYPPNVYYLQEHYGLILDEDKYIYEYEPVAENIKPVIQIFIKPGFE
ncbi:hypothetical protein EZV73_20870 [Acidaminobacter sp. JC074]|uniref:hypothetical protein n=1 Tax=Acidaminobacter sp. JC074 TaxID=2530199 RepID=UPI001F0E57CC|nr:hypothetical protein [Acidaminobacter sp. JC074]MCH4890045.1 hypothetical protein [Acidaminobacter sp. JC074]